MNTTNEEDILVLSPLKNTFPGNEVTGLF